MWTIKTGSRCTNGISASGGRGGFVLANGLKSAQSCAVRSFEDVSKCAAEEGLSEGRELEKGLGVYPKAGVW